MISISNRQSGAVSLFVVIFATLLITVVTVSFLRLMISDQNQAASNDLSQSAYDSAQAGIEDAKRALLRYQAICDRDGESACRNLANDIDNAACNAALVSVLPSADIQTTDGTATGEVRVQQSASSESDKKLDQAYTCVKIKLKTDDYVGSLSDGQSKLVPLKGIAADGTTSFNRVTVNWFTGEDIGQATSGAYAVDVPVEEIPRSLFLQSAWPANRPPVLRVQLMQFGSNFSLSEFDTMTDSNQSNANTVFLYPAQTGAATNSFVSRDSRRTDGEAHTPKASSADAPLGATCQPSLSTGGYACSATFTLPTPVGGGTRTAFLRITPLYNHTHFQVTLNRSGTTPLQFNGVQPEIDSTGRANSMFRRVASRVDLIDTSFPYPDGAVDVAGNLCKDFAVTPDEYIGTACEP